MKRRLLACILASMSVAGSALAAELEGTRAAAKAACPTPEEAQKLMVVPDGYEVRCFAHEPMVVNPVAMTWDSRGRLWVVEGYEYPEGSPYKNEAFGGEVKDDKYHPVPEVCKAKDNPVDAMRADHPKIPKDRIVILEDTDNDGIADKRTVFLEGLDMGSAIICGDGGVYVGQQPHILHFKDTDGDDHADEWRVVLTGFGREDTHELLNSFCWGPDGWLYMTHGVFTHSAVRRPRAPVVFDAETGRTFTGEPVDKGVKFDAGIGRARPVTAGKEAPWTFEVFADGTSNPWGCDYDEKGNFFVSACVIDHFFHMSPGGIYVRQGGAPENPYSYELLPSIVHHKHFRAAYAGVQIYQGGVYPQDTWGHAFIGNIHDNAIHEEVLTPSGSTFLCEPRRDFLRANSGWFRPVSTRTGPDGNLWVMDWCDKYPCYQNAKANPAGVDREKGRIWRVVYTGKEGRGASWSAAASDSATPLSPEPKISASKKDQETPKSGVALSLPTALQDASRPSKEMDLSKLETPALVKLLGDSNNWMRRWARREMVERLSPSFQGFTTLDEKDEQTQNRRKAMVPLVALISNQALPAWQRLEALRTYFSISDADLPPWICGKSLAASLQAWEFNPEPLAADKDPAIRQGLATYIADKFTAYRGTLNTGSLFIVPKLDILKRLSQDKDPGVLAACAHCWRTITTGRLTSDRMEGGSWPEEFGVLLKAASQNSDPVLADLIWMAVEQPLSWVGEGRAFDDWTKWMIDCQPLSHVLSYKTMRRLCDTRKVENMDLALGFIAKIKAEPELLARALEGLEKGQETGILKPTKDFSALFAEFAKSDNADIRRHAQRVAMLWGDEKAIREVAAILLDGNAQESQRIATVQTLRLVKANAVRAVFSQVLAVADKQPAALVTEVIRATADLGGDAFVSPLITLAASKDNSIRIAALGSLAGRAEWTHAMLDAIKAGKVSAGGFPASIRRQLATGSDKAVSKHATEVLGAWQEIDENLKAVITAKRKACLEGEPDIAAGKQIFQTTCMVCHTFFGGGQKVGPELIGSGRSNLDAILANVIDPNQIIGNGYEGFILTTTDNQILMGRVTEDTPSYVKLLAIGGAEQTVERSKIAKLENTHKSLMPVGFGSLPDDQFRNLIWYVLAPPEEGPLTKEKRKLLSTSIDAPAAPARATGNYAIDWESVSLWNPQWKVSAPEFERTPLKLGEYYGRSNVLLMHPFPDKKTPTSLERTLVIDPAKHTLKFAVASDDRGDWELVVKAGEQVLKKVPVDHEKPRWKDVSVDLSAFAGKQVTLRLEGHATGWSYEFGYWADVRLE